MNTPSFMRGFVQAVASWRVVGSCGFTASLMPPHASPGPFHPRPLFPVHVCDWWHAEKSTVFLLLCCFPQALLVVCSDIPGKKKKNCKRSTNEAYASSWELSNISTYLWEFNSPPYTVYRPDYDSARCQRRRGSSNKCVFFGKSFQACE